MNPARPPSLACTLLLPALLALAAVLAVPGPALAQTEACPRPAGATPVAPPGVTAAEVEGDTGALRDFALAARERSREHAQHAAPTEQGLYIGCLIRQEDGVWRSGSTYLVSLTPDGRVFIHAKNMALSGGLLNPAIYAQILVALGVSPADLAGLASPDPATAGAALQAVLGALSREPDAAFDATAIAPGASGYASVYVSSDYQAPIVLLAGFDLTASHLAPEEIDYGNPTVTARDVVDRETLKAFVTQAGDWFLEIQKSGDAAAVSRARVALRDPNGPWRHGSVYLYVLDTANDIVLFHATQPDRFEYRPLRPTVRDVVTGEYILPQIVEAATSGPDGGFVEYHYDDPTDHTDSADIPKTGYAREFSVTFAGRPLDFIVASGFYGSPGAAPPPPAADADPNRAVETVLPQIVRAMTAGTVDAISARMRRLSSGEPAEAEARIGGATALTDALLANRMALESGNFDPARLLAGSSFVLPLAGGAGGPLQNLTLWGSGDYRSFSGGRSVGYDGDVTGAHLGLDTRLGANLLAGLSVGRARGAVDYRDGAAAGELTATVTGIAPYAGWQSAGGLSLWAAAGHGWGEVELDGPAGAESGDLTQQMAAAGASGRLLASTRLSEGGTTSIRLKGEAAYTRAELDGSGRLAGATLDASRLRLAIEGSHAQRLGSGASFTPTVEIGLRRDGGDGETGNGVEAGGGMRYADPASGLAVAIRGRTLLAHGGDYEEWGVAGSLRFDPGAAGRGLAIGVAPAWGATASGTRRLWETGIPGAGAAGRPAGRVSARIAYGIAGPGGGLLTPYGALALSDAGDRRASLGGRLDIAPAAHVGLEAAQSRAASGATSHALILRGSLTW